LKYIAYCRGFAFFQSIRTVLPLPVWEVTYAGSPHFSVSSISPTSHVAAASSISLRSAIILRRIFGGYASNLLATAALWNGFIDSSDFARMFY
jgi:hypothetical protein